MNGMRQQITQLIVRLFTIQTNQEHLKQTI